MTRLAFEAPFADIEFAFALSDYVFGIAPLIRRSESYRAAILATEKELYLDNGEYEGQRMTVDDFLLVCNGNSASVVVAPDVIGDLEGTIRLTEDFVNKLAKVAGYKPKVIGVLQGRNTSEKLDCLYSFREFGIDIIGLGLGAFFKNWRERLDFAREVKPERIHVLGIANTIDFGMWVGIAETIDTSLPFHCAQLGQRLPFVAKGGTRLDWDKPLGPRGLVLAGLNVWHMWEILDAAV